jgi:Zn finger protein HypA/HybF involved in hydrogenase expression
MENETFLPNTITTDGGEYFCQLCYNQQQIKTVDDNEVEIAQIILKRNEYFPMCPIHLENTVWEKGRIEYEEPEEKDADETESYEKYEFECSECGKIVKEEDKICPYCGANLSDIAEIEEKIVSFNFGAAFLSPAWLISHGEIFSAFLMAVYFGVLKTVFDLGDDMAKLILAVIAIILNIYWGISGNEIAYEYKKYKNIKQFNKEEKVWVFSGIMAGIAQIFWFYNELNNLVK